MTRTLEPSAIINGSCKIYPPTFWNKFARHQLLQRSGLFCAAQQPLAIFHTASPFTAHVQRLISFQSCSKNKWQHKIKDYYPKESGKQNIIWQKPSVPPLTELISYQACCNSETKNCFYFIEKAKPHTKNARNKCWQFSSATIPAWHCEHLLLSRTHNTSTFLLRFRMLCPSPWKEMAWIQLKKTAARKSNIQLRQAN